MVKESFSTDFFQDSNNSIKWSNISLNEILNLDNKLVAKAHSIYKKQVLEILNNCGLELKNITGNNSFATAYRPGICKRIFVDKKYGITMYTPSQITDIDPFPVRYLSKKTKANLNNWMLKEGEILLTCSGTIGFVSYVSKTLSNKCFSQNLIRIIADEYPGYLYTYLRSKSGQILLTSSNYGAVIKHIDPSHLDNIPIPNPPDEIKEKIHNLIIESYSLRDDSNDLVKSARILLYEELKLPPIDDINIEYLDNEVNVKSFAKSLKNLDLRIDGSYHVPIINKITEIIRKNSKEVKDLSDKNLSSSIFLPGRFKRIYVEDGSGVTFFGGKQMYELDPLNKKFLSLAHHSNRIKEQLTLAQNTILITRSGTIGKVTITPKHWEKWVANEHIIRVEPASSGIAGYLYTWLSSDYGHELIKRHTYGAVVDEINDCHVGNVKIPIVKNDEVKSKINSMVLNANKQRYEAYLKEQEALKILNKEVLKIAL